MIPRRPKDRLGKRGRFIAYGPLTLTALIAWVAVPAAAAPPAGASLADWGLHCFCIDATSTPHRVIRSDDNGRILLAARDGATLASLRAAGIAASDSQIALLRAYRLLRQDGATLRTTFPILGRETIVPLRVRSASLARGIADAIRPDVAAIGNELDRRGTPDSRYAIIFGYALDGLVWTRLRTARALPETRLTADEPFWRGAFWAIDPERAGAAGTNQSVGTGGTLVATWFDPVVRRLDAFSESSAGCAIGAKAPGSMVAVVASPEGPIPVVRTRAGDRLHDPADRIAAGVVAAISTDEGRALLAAVPNATRQQAMVIVMHELIWDVADALVANGALLRPIVAEGKGRLGPLLFLQTG